jgi:hypothetical protein
MRMTAAIAIGSDCISIGIVVKLIAISSDCVLMNISLNQLQSAQIVYQWMSTVVLTVGLMVGSTVGLTVNSTWLCWAIDLNKAFNSSAKRLLRLSTKRV